MGSTRFQVVLLDKSHDRKAFASASPLLNRYLHEQVSQDIRRRVASCFVAVPQTEPNTIAGFYTLSSASIWLDALPQEQARQLPRYPSVPAVRLGRLAVHQAFQGQGLGAALLADALTRCLQSEIAAYALVVDAKDEAAARFYAHHGFVTLQSPLNLFLPLATARQLLK